MPDVANKKTLVQPQLTVRCTTYLPAETGKEKFEIPLFLAQRPSPDNMMFKSLLNTRETASATLGRKMNIKLLTRTERSMKLTASMSVTPHFPSNLKLVNLNTFDVIFKNTHPVRQYDRKDPMGIHEEWFTLAHVFDRS